MLFIDCPSTPKRRRFFEPRYINEIKTPDVCTPRKARRVIGMVKRHASIQTKKIRQLQGTRRVLLKKVRSLEDMVTHLKQKNLISEQAGEHMVVS